MAFEDVGLDGSSPDAGRVSSGNRITATIDGVTYTYNNRMTAPTPFEEGLQTRAYADDAPTTYWGLVFPTTPGVYSCAEGGEASASHLVEGSFGAGTASTGGPGACTFEVLEAGPVWRATFSGAGYFMGTEKTIVDGYYEFDPSTAPGGGDTAFPAGYHGVLLTVEEPESLADTYLVDEIRSENSEGTWLFVSQNITVAPEFMFDLRNVPLEAGTHTCGDDALQLRFQNNINGSVHWQNGGSCTIDLTTFMTGSDVEGTFEAELPALVGSGTVRISGSIRASHPG